MAKFRNSVAAQRTHRYAPFGHPPEGYLRRPHQHTLPPFSTRRYVDLRDAPL
jgi:hypothetical protein